MGKTHYETLGVAEDASEAELKKAYRVLAKKHHPDKNPGDPTSEARFKELSGAFEVLKDQDKRRQYDAERKLPHMGASGFSPFGDAFTGFEDFFRNVQNVGGFSRSHRRNQAPVTVPGQSIRIQQSVTLASVLKINFKTVNVQRNKRCQICAGKGASNEAGAIQPCDLCNGTGQHTLVHGNLQIQQTCPQCGGQGEKIVKPCKGPCHGQGLSQTTEQITVKIPCGISSGDTLRVAGKGDESKTAGAQPGDLFIVIDVQQHHGFEREGSELFTTQSLPFTTATLGGTFKIPVLSDLPGETKEVTILPGTAVDGQITTYDNLGVPDMNTSIRGKLHIRYSVEVPKLAELTSEQKELLRQLHNTFEEREWENESVSNDS